MGFTHIEVKSLARYPAFCFACIRGRPKHLSFERPALLSFDRSDVWSGTAVTVIELRPGTHLCRSCFDPSVPLRFDFGEARHVSFPRALLERKSKEDFLSRFGSRAKCYRTR